MIGYLFFYSSFCPPPEFHWIESVPQRFKIVAMKIACSCSTGDAILIQVGLWVKQDDTVPSQQEMRTLLPAITCFSRLTVFDKQRTRLRTITVKYLKVSFFFVMSNSKWHYRCDHTCSIFRNCDGSLLFRDQTWRRASYEVQFDSSRRNIPSHVNNAVITHASLLLWLLYVVFYLLLCCTYWTACSKTIKTVNVHRCLKAA